MAEPPLPYDQLTLSLRVIELGGWDNVIFRLPAGSNIKGSFSSMPEEDRQRGYWLCVDHVKVQTKAGNLRIGENAVLSICSQDLDNNFTGQIIDVREKPKDTRSGFACRYCVRERTMGRPY